MVSRDVYFVESTATSSQPRDELNVNASEGEKEHAIAFDMGNELTATMYQCKRSTDRKR